MRKTLLALWIILLGAFSAPSLAVDLFKVNQGPSNGGLSNQYCGANANIRGTTVLEVRDAWITWANANPTSFQCSGTTWTADCGYPGPGRVCKSVGSLTVGDLVLGSATNPCSTDQIFSYVSQTCQPKCSSDASIASDNPNCVAPPSACLNKATEQVAYQVTNGLTANSYCDGSCNFTVEFNNDRTTCWNYEGSTTRYCDFDKVYPGTECTVADNMAADTNATTTGGTVTAGTGAQTEASCPTGYTLGTDNLCHAPSTPGTASTSDTAGTAGTTGTTTCPVGYAQLDGNCVANPTGATANTCPDGYTLTNGTCISSQTISAGGGTGSGASTGEQAAVEADGNALVSATGAPSHGWSWSAPIPTSTCQAWHIAAGGLSLDIDPCPVAEKLRALFAFVFYILTAYGLFSILFKSEAAA